MFNASVLKRVSALFVISFLAAASAHATGWQQNGNNTYYSDGNVGIGTTNPTATLDLQSSTNSSWAAQIQNMGTTGAHGLYVNIGASSTGIPFRVDKNGSPLLQVINNGNVGIGTTNPGATLTTFGDTWLDSVGSTDRTLYFRNQATVGTIQSDKDLRFKTYGSGGWFIPMYIQASGNVGIGTTNPTATLDLQSSTNSSWAAQIQNMGTTGAHGLYVNIGASSTGIPFRVDKNGSPLLQVINNGNVGIGTTNPTQALCVNGKIVAKDVQVTQAGWSDFVFAPNYRLMPLNVLEKKIEQSGHLPGIPNSKQVQKDGVSVGEMQGKLLQKVEELTLYVIQQQKEIDTLKKEIKNNKK